MNWYKFKRLLIFYTQNSTDSVKIKMKGSFLIAPKPKE